MATKSYVVSVPMKHNHTSTHKASWPDTEALQEKLQELLTGIDEAGEAVVAVQAIQAGWGATFQNQQYFGGENPPLAYGAGLGFSYTDALVVITRTP